MKVEKGKYSIENVSIHKEPKLVGQNLERVLLNLFCDRKDTRYKIRIRN